MTSATAGAGEAHVMAQESGYLACLRYVNCLERRVSRQWSVSLLSERADETRIRPGHLSTAAGWLCLRLPGAAIRYTIAVWDTRNT